MTHPLALMADILDPAEAKNGWRTTAREEQLLPPGEWRIIFIRGGRGSGKTRSCAEGLAELIRSSEPGEWAVVAPTYGDGRDVCIEGPSGLRQALGPLVATWNRSLGELRCSNGSVVWVDGADDGALRVQGKNLRGAWLDEAGLWRWNRASRRSGKPTASGGKTAWEESIRFAVRLAPAKIIVSGTPKAGHPLVKELMADPQVIHRRLRMSDNIANLDQATVQELLARYEGTRLGRQELEGEVLEDVEGALWNMEMIEPYRIDPQTHPDEAREILAQLRRIVVAVDPSWGTKGDECGIIVCGLGWDGRGYVLEDRSRRMAPSDWGATAAEVYRNWNADRLLCEVNFQGEQVRLVMQTTDPTIPVKEVRVTRGKQLRAEPILALYEQSKVGHVGRFAGLEDQMTSWVPDESDFSPDRVDALVMALDELMLDPGTVPHSVSPAGRRKIAG